MSFIYFLLGGKILLKKNCFLNTPISHYVIKIRTHRFEQHSHKTITNGSEKNGFRDSRSTYDDILQLRNPLFFVFHLRTASEFLFSSQNQRYRENVALKPLSLLKTKKKIKEYKKRTSDAENSLLTNVVPKKNIRSKIVFDETYASIQEMFKNTTLKQEKMPLSVGLPHELSEEKSTVLSFKIRGKRKEQLPLLEIKNVETLDLGAHKNIIIVQPITVVGLSKLLSVATIEIIKCLFLKNILVTENQYIDFYAVQVVGKTFGVNISLATPTEFIKEKSTVHIKNIFRATSFRAPLIAIVGDTGCGKTTLWNCVQHTSLQNCKNVESTQKIAVCEISIDCEFVSKKVILFDTPGHSAFLNMKYRAMNAADAVMVVLSAKDNLSLSTIETLQQLEISKVPILIVLNKIDKEDAKVETLKKDLLTHNVRLEECGGEVLLTSISATKGTNMDSLLTMLVRIEKKLHLPCTFDGVSEGIILETLLDKKYGVSVLVIVQNGTLHIGDSIEIDAIRSKIRKMTSFLGKNLQEAGPSTPVLLWGLEKSPTLGASFSAFSQEKRELKPFAKKATRILNPLLGSFSQQTTSIIHNNIENKTFCNLIFKTDTQGSAEAIHFSAHKIHYFDTYFQILYSDFGEVTKTDVIFANRNRAILVSFNAPITNEANSLAKKMSLMVKKFVTICDLLMYLQNFLEKLRNPYPNGKCTGIAVIKEIFPLAKTFAAGFLVIEGKIRRNTLLHVFRNNTIVYNGLLYSLKKGKETVDEVSQGEECGVFLNNFDVWKHGDLIKTFEIPLKKDLL